MTDTTDRINHLLVEHLGVEPIAVVPEALLVPAHDNMGRVVASDRTDLGCDSLDVVEIVMALEEEFGIEITDDEGERLNTGTVGDVHALVESKVAKQPA